MLHSRLDKTFEVVKSKPSILIESFHERFILLFLLPALEFQKAKSVLGKMTRVRKAKQLFLFANRKIGPSFVLQLRFECYSSRLEIVVYFLKLA